jgi:sigma-B regulation protein RsbU (phosphoserine phosphatase)
VASHYAAATEIGGDYFDFLPLEGNRLGLAFGDVAGHGLTSGIVMAMAKSALLVQADHDASPLAVMEALNEIVLKTAPKRMLMTFFFGSLDLATGELEFCSAGHLDPYVVRRGGGRPEPLSAWGFPLGVRRRHPFVLHRTLLEPGDLLVLYSDGLIEAIDDDGEPYGFSRFEELLVRHGTRSPEELRKEILSSVRRFTRNRPPEDDQTLVILSFEGSRRASKVA